MGVDFTTALRHLGKSGNLIFTILTFTVAMMHITNVLDYTYYCKDEPTAMQYIEGETECVGKNLVWVKGDNAYKDNNRPQFINFAEQEAQDSNPETKKYIQDGGNEINLPPLGYRDAFTTAPDHFIDTWSPFMLSMFLFTQLFPTTRWDFLNSWSSCLAFWIFSTFFCITGYAGNLGVVVGLLILCPWCFPILASLMIFDGENEDCHYDVIEGTEALFEMIGMDLDLSRFKQVNKGTRGTNHV